MSRKDLKEHRKAFVEKRKAFIGIYKTRPCPPLDNVARAVRVNRKTALRWLSLVPQECRPADRRRTLAERRAEARRLRAEQPELTAAEVARRSGLAYNTAAKLFKKHEAPAEETPAPPAVDNPRDENTPPGTPDSGRGSDSGL